MADEVGVRGRGAEDGRVAVRDGLVGEVGGVDPVEARTPPRFAHGYGQRGRSVGSRSAISTQLLNEHLLDLVTDRLCRAGLATSRLALPVAREVARAAVNRKTRRAQ